MSLLKQDTIKKRRVVEEVRQMEFNTSDNKSREYEVEAIRDSTVYARESESGYLSSFYYLVSWKGYPEEENTWKPASAVQYLRKLISSFHKDHSDKLTATSPAIDTAPPMARLTIRLTVKSSEPPKQKWGQLTNSTNKQVKKNWVAFDFYCIFGQIWVSSILDILNRTVRDCTWQHMTARDFQPTFIKTSIF